MKLSMIQIQDNKIYAKFSDEKRAVVYVLLKSSTTNYPKLEHISYEKEWYWASGTNYIGYKHAPRFRSLNTFTRQLEEIQRALDDSNFHKVDLRSKQ
jgi:hypothetical protein